VDIPDLGSDLVGVALRTSIVYVALIVGFRLIGKSRTGQLATIDLIVLLVIANAVQNAMVGQNDSLIGGIIAAAVILLLDRALHAVTDRWPEARRIVEGEPTMLVEEGRVLPEPMRREGISPHELAMALRENGLMTAEEAQFVFLETTGVISVIPYRDGAGSNGGRGGSSKDQQIGG
jgi:uncharacterized membrane protein YcaP (DUF421 family)